MTSRLHTEQEYKDLLSEHQIVQRKLEHKVEALLKVSQELVECQKEKQTHKTQAQEYAERCKAMKMAMVAQKRERNRKESAAEEQQHNLVHVFKCVKEENKSLNEEIESLKSQLEEAKCDIKLMKAELSRQKLEHFLQNDDQNEPSTSSKHAQGNDFCLSRRSSLKSNNDILQELEKIKCEYGLLERDLKTLLCEKEELIVERDAYKTKTERQNAELNLILNGDERRLMDIDSLLGENRYLKERLQNAQEENGMTKAALSKYKGILEKSKKSSLKNDNSKTSQGSSPTAPGIQLITAKQARAFLGQANDNDKVHKNIDYRALATALFEAVGDKTLALSHLRKANKILGTRVTELENKLNVMDRSVSKSPCKMIKVCPLVKITFKSMNANSSGGRIAAVTSELMFQKYKLSRSCSNTNY
uniref:Coiled-coil domain-containing protein n=1 Tax=Romanomermis culicivorax TaxID=13658 RepID=A0A915L150_ROMCU